MNDILYWIWFSLKCRPGSSEGLRLLEHFPQGPRQIFEANEGEILSIGGINSSFLRRFLDHNLDRAKNILEFCFMNSIKVVSYFSDYYPTRLKNIFNAPPVLYVKGNIEELGSRLCVGVVGTRNMTDYGKHATFDIVRNLAGCGAVTISGAAYGIDSVANNTALYFESKTVAVLGSGIDVPYPRENREMLERVAKNGMVVSEYPPGTPPLAYHFPLRNRIISGMADAVLVVEADMKSGAIITAKYAASQGRPLYAVPGQIDHPTSRGTNRLIHDGAKLCSTAEDIIEDFVDKFDLSPIESIVNSEAYLRYEMRNRNRMESTRGSHNPIHLSNPQDKPSIHQKLSANRQAAPTRDEALTPKKEAEPTEKIKSSSASVKNSDTTRVNDIMESESNNKESKTGSGLDHHIYSRLDAIQRAVLDAMPIGSAVNIDKLTENGLQASEIMASMTILELYAAVEALPGGLYRRLIDTK